jgi:endonuclease III
MKALPLDEILARLERHHGKAKPPLSKDPWTLVLLENVAYLVDDERRLAIFKTLKSRVGIQPADILGAPLATLLEIVGGGMLKEQQVEKLRSCAQIALNSFDGNVSAAAALPLSPALKAFKKFPGIGEPGASRILLFSGNHAVYALESNAVRVLVRLGVIREEKSYSATYRAVRTALEKQLKPDGRFLLRLHQLLRQHGQTLCRRSLPDCDVCPLANACAHARSQRSN